MSEEPIACQLTDSEFRARRDRRLAAVRDMVVSATWRYDGLALEVPPSSDALGARFQPVVAAFAGDRSVIRKKMFSVENALTVKGKIFAMQVDEGMDRHWPGAQAGSTSRERRIAS